MNVTSGDVVNGTVPVFLLPENQDRVTLDVRIYDNDYPSINVESNALLMHHGKMVHYALARLDGSQFAHVHPGSDLAGYDADAPLKFEYALEPGFYMLGCR